MVYPHDVHVMRKARDVGEASPLASGDAQRTWERTCAATDHTPHLSRPMGAPTFPRKCVVCSNNNPLVHNARANLLQPARVGADVKASTRGNARNVIRMNIQEAIDALIAQARALMGIMGTFSDVTAQDKWGNAPVHADKAARLRAEAGLADGYVVTKYVAAALTGSKARKSAYELAGVDPRNDSNQSQIGDGVESREAPVATLTATITDAPDAYVNSGENVAILANAAAGIYRYHTSHGLSLDARIVGTKLTIRELGAIARAIGVHV